MDPGTSKKINQQIVKLWVSSPCVRVDLWGAGRLLRNGADFRRERDGLEWNGLERIIIWTRAEQCCLEWKGFMYLQLTDLLCMHDTFPCVCPSYSLVYTQENQSLVYTQESRVYATEDLLCIHKRFSFACAEDSVV